MVWHFATPDTLDLGIDLGSGKRLDSGLHDFMPVLRGGEFESEFLAGALEANPRAPEQ